MSQHRNAAGVEHLKRRRWLAESVAKEQRPPTYRCRWTNAYRSPMGDTRASEDWAGYLRRMTSRPGWSVAKLAREANIHRGTIFKWMKGESGVTVASVRAIAEALGDDPANALRAAGSVASETDPRDDEIALVVSDPNLDPEMKRRILQIIVERRERERQSAIEETRRVIELFRRKDTG